MQDYEEDAGFLRGVRVVVVNNLAIFVRLEVGMESLSTDQRVFSFLFLQLLLLFSIFFSLAITFPSFTCSFRYASFLHYTSFFAVSHSLNLSILHRIGLDRLGKLHLVGATSFLLEG